MPTKFRSRPYQVDAINAVHHALMAGKDRFYIKLGTGAGKCHGPNAPILMFNGSIKKAKDIVVGDELMGPDSRPRKVLVKSKGRGEMYQVTPIKGDSHIFNGDHIITLRASSPKRGYKAGDLIDIEIKDWFNWNNSMKRQFKWARVGVDWPYKEVFNPYLMGLYLGDGGIYHQTITNGDKEIQDYLAPMAQRCWEETNCFGYSLSLSDRKNFRRCLDGKIKFIPEEYKINSQKVRLEMLAGLLDTDGHYHNNGYYEITTKHERLRDDILFLSRSLGLAAYSADKYVALKGWDRPRLYFRIIISGELDNIPCRVERKKAAKRRQIKNVLNSGFDIKAIGYGEYHGWVIDGDRRYLMGDFTITHNTVIIVQLFEKYLAVKPSLNFLFVVPKNVLIEQTVEKFSYPNVSIYCAGLNQKQFNSITVGSVQSLVNAKDLPHVDMTIMDEGHRVRSAHVKLHQALLKINPEMKTIGMTATDYDINKDFFTEKVYDIDRTTLTAQGYLAPIVIKSGKDKIDTSDVSMSGGDFVLKELEDRMDIDKIKAQVKDMLSKTQDRKFILIMCISINHAVQIQGMINCFILHSKQSKEYQRHNLESWKKQGGYLASVLIPSEGFDHVESDCLALMRPTRSATLYDQAVGRISRLAPNKTNGLFLDYGDVVLELGDPYNITPFQKKKKTTHKICIHCDAIVTISSKHCPECNELFYNECQVCHKRKPCGEICCKRKPYDILGNLTGNAFDGAKWIEVTSVTKTPYISKKGTKCFKVQYWSGLKHICDEYLFTNSDKNYKNIKAIKVTRLKFKEITGRLFNES